MHVPHTLTGDTQRRVSLSLFLLLLLLSSSEKMDSNNRGYEIEMRRRSYCGQDYEYGKMAFVATCIILAGYLSVYKVLTLVYPSSSSLTLGQPEVTEVQGEGEPEIDLRTAIFGNDEKQEVIKKGPHLERFFGKYPDSCFCIASSVCPLLNSTLSSSDKNDVEQSFDTLAHSEPSSLSSWPNYEPGRLVDLGFPEQTLNSSSYFVFYALVYVSSYESMTSKGSQMMILSKETCGIVDEFAIQVFSNDALLT